MSVLTKFIKTYSD